MTQYTVSIDDPRKDAGAVKALELFNADQAVPLTMNDYLLRVLDPQLVSWADSLAPAVIPSGTWLKRWTAAEKAWARASTDPQIKAWLVDLDDSETVDLTHAKVRQGVPYVCNAMEAEGFLAQGQGAVRAAAILAF